MTLLEPQVNYYVIKEKWWGWGSGDIYDQRGNTIGSMHRRLLTIREFTEVKENDGTISFTVNRKIVSIRASYTIKDPNGNFLGRTNRKILTLFRPKLWLEDEKGKKMLEAQGNFLGKDFKIKDTRGRLIAQVGKSDFFKDLILGGSLFDYTDTYAVKILDPSYDKRILLGFVIAIDNSVHDKKK
ncbi:MAG: LURP-one-related/scramblase family protein [Candidatus Bathyarchaeia archaeon]